MKKIIILFVLSIFLLASGVPLFASNNPKGMDHTGFVGKKIHESTIKDYHLAYHLLDLPGRKEKHLVVYVKDPNAKSVTKAKVGYLVVGPNGVKQKVMAMGMKDSFGGDIDFTEKGIYVVNAKALIGDVKLLDQFKYESD